MSLKGLLKFGKELMKAKKPSATPATGQQTKQITYTPKPSQQTGQELALREIRNPPIVRKVTKELHMGDDVAPAFGSSTYDWVMRKGAGKYTADEWIDHLTGTRQIKLQMFGKPITQTIRDQKRFKYDRGPFAGKEVNVSKEELFDSNLAIFNETGDLTGGLLYAAKKFGLKLDANEVGAMIKLNPVNRLRPIELGIPKGAMETFERTTQTAADQLKNIRKNYETLTTPGSGDITGGLDEVLYKLRGLKNDPTGRAVNSFTEEIKMVRNNPGMRPEDRKVINKVLGEVNEASAPMKSSKTVYQKDTPYTLQGGKDYRESIMVLDDAIPTNQRPFTKGSHFSDKLPNETNSIYHVRWDTRFTPEGKKVFMINEIQSDVNQSIAKALSKGQQLGGEKRFNPFQVDLEIKMLLTQRAGLMDDLNKAIATQDSGRVNFLSKTLADINKKYKLMTNRSGDQYDFFPLLEADAYSDHAVKYLIQKAAREGADYVAMAPFDKVSFRQGFAAGNERVYGYASGKGIGKQGKAIVPEAMKKLSRFYNSKAGPIKISLSDPKLPYKKIGKDTFKYESAGHPKAPIKESHPLKGKTITSTYHEDAVKDPTKGYKLILENDPRLYFDAFAIRVMPAMRNTQKTYKALGGLVVDIFKERRYN
mgnify:CR=1 FL=1|tara:strand:+ start:34 stop:1980 length:1947 start_codon:yes stop_codon:yes gene_type:complete